MFTVGLFGPREDISWQDAFIECLSNLEGVEYFDPLRHEALWVGEDMSKQTNTFHRAKDDVIVFPVTAKTYGFSSLAEIGFEVVHMLQAHDQQKLRSLVVFIEQDADATLPDPAARQESLRIRKLVLERLLRLNLPNVYVVDSLEDMLDVTVRLCQAHVLTAPLQFYLPQNHPPRP